MKMIRLFWLVVQTHGWLTVSLLTIAALALTATSLILASPRTATNPFASFDDLFQSNARQAALVHHIDCLGDAEETVACIQRIGDRHFSSVYLQLSHNATEELSLSVRANTLTLGDLVLLWGEPDLLRYCETTVATWPARHIMSIVAPRQAPSSRYRWPVLSVSITRGAAPHWEPVLMNDTLQHCGSVISESLEDYSRTSRPD